MKVEQLKETSFQSKETRQPDSRIDYKHNLRE